MKEILSQKLTRKCNIKSGEDVKDLERRLEEFAIHDLNSTFTEEIQKFG